jgi:hypothetical protein
VNSISAGMLPMNLLVQNIKFWPGAVKNAAMASLAD